MGWRRSWSLSLAALLAAGLPLGMEQASAVGGTGVLTGVLSSSVGPLEGAKVEVHLVGQVVAGSDTSDSTGTYRIDGLAAGDYIVDISGPGIVPKTLGDPASGDTPFAVDGGAMVEASATLTRTATIAGYVTNTFTGARLAGVTVRFVRDSAVDEGETVTDENGDYQLGDLPPGQYTVTASGPGALEAALQLALAEGDRAMDVEISTRSGSTISGTVTDLGGQPIEGATVRAVTEFGQEHLAATGPDGRYEISGITANVLVRATAPGYGPASLDADGDGQPDILSGDVDEVYVADLVLEPAGGIVGTVLDTAGNPLAGVSVIGESLDGGDQLEDITDDFGGYHLEAPAGAYFVRFKPAQPYLSEYYDDVRGQVDAVVVEVAGGQTVSGIDASLVQSGSLSGRVTDQAGNALAGAWVYIFTPDFTSGYTDNDGRFAVTELPPGTFAAEALWRGRSVSLEVTVVAGEDRVVEAVIEVERGWIAGLVTDAAGVPVVGADVTINGDSAYSAKTGVDGRYRIAGVDTGSKTVEVSAPGAGTEYKYLDIQPGENLVDVEMSFPGTVAGVVTVGGSPQAGIAVTLETVEGGWGPTAYTDESGRYQLVDVPNADYRVRFVPDPSVAVAEYYDDAITAIDAAVVSVGPRAEISGVDADLGQPAYVEGVVTDSAGDPMVGVAVLRVDTWAWVQAVTDEFGRYRLGPLAPGRFDLKFSHWRAETKVVTVDAGSGTTALDVSLNTPTGALQVTVVDQDGAVIEGARVFSGSGSQQFDGTTGPDGIVRFDDLTLGVFWSGASVQLEPWGYGSVPTFTIAEGETTEVTVSIVVGGAVSGEVTWAAGEFQAVAVQLIPVDATSGSHTASLWGSGSGSSYRIASVPPGDYHVRFETGYWDTLISEWYDDVTDRGSATVVHVERQVEASGIDATMARGAQVVGTVHQSNGAVSGAMDVFDGPGPDARFVGSVGWDGRIDVRKLPAGTYALSFRASSGLTAALGDPGMPEPITVALGDVITLDITLPVRLGALDITVVGTDGEPVPRALLWINTVMSTTVTTDDEGHYLLRGLAPRSYSVTARATDHLPATAGAGVQLNETTELTITLPDGVLLGGSVTDTNGSPIAGADIEIQPHFQNVGGSPRTATTSGDGSFQLPGRVSEGYGVSVRKDGFVTHEGSVYVDGANDDRLDIVLRRVASVSGRVVDGAGEPVIGAWFSADGLAPTQFNAPDGSFSLAPLDARTYTFTVSAADHIPSSLTVWLGEGESLAGVEVVLRRSGTIQGRIIDPDGNPLRWADVYWIGEPARVYPARTNESGDFLLQGVVGSGRLQVVGAIGGPAQYVDLDEDLEADEFVVADGKTVDIGTYQVVRGGEITGTVTANGRPATPVWAIVYDAGAGAWVSSTLVDPTSGEYRLQGLPPGGRFVVYFATNDDEELLSEFFDDAWERSSARVVVVPRGGVVSGVDADLVTKAELRGVVTLPGGMPAAGALLTLSGPGDATTKIGVDDRNGSYSYRRLLPGSYRLRVDRAGLLAPMFVDVEIGRGGVVTRDIVLDLKLATLTGRITDTAGAGIGGATVRASAFGQGETTTADDGTYRIEGLVGPGAQVEVRKAGFATVSRPVALNGVTVFDAVLHRSTVVVGIVVGSGGAPVSGARITAAGPPDNGVPMWREATTDSEGTYRLDLPYGGDYTFAVAAGGYVTPQPQRRTVAEGDTHRFDVSLQRGVTVAGRVEHAGRGVARAEVWAIGASPTFTNDNGEFALTGVASTATVMTTVADGYASASTPIEVPSDGSDLTGVIVRLEALASLTGRVELPDGSPVAGATVAWRPTGGLIGSWTSPVATGDDGRFAIKALGTGVLNIAAAGFADQYFDGDGTPGSDTFSLTDGASRDAGTHVLAGPGAMRGSVTGEGRPLAGIGVQIVGLDRRRLTTVTTGDDGTYRADGLAPGRYIVHFLGDGDWSPEWYEDAVDPTAARAVVVVGGAVTESVDAELAPAARVRGTVVGPNGERVSGAFVSLTTLDGRIYTTTTDDRGWYEVGGMSVGTWSIFIQPSMATMVTLYVARIDVGAGEQIERDVRLGAAGAVVLQVADGAMMSWAICSDPGMPAPTGDGRVACTQGSSPALGAFADESSITAFGLPSGTYNAAAMLDSQTMTSVATFAVVAGGTQYCTLPSDSPSNCSGSGSGSDDDAPIIECSSPRPVFLLHQVGARATGRATDAGESWEVAAPADTSTVGRHSVTMSATDAAGNTGTVDCAYDVRYRFYGFRSPLSNSRVNKVRYSQYVPLNWKLYDADGDEVGLADAVVSVDTVRHRCPADMRLKTMRSTPTASQGLEVLRPGKFRYVWRPGRSNRKRCVTLTVTLNDGTKHSAEFYVR